MHLNKGGPLATVAQLAVRRRAPRADVADVLAELAPLPEFVYMRPLVSVGDKVIGPSEAADFPTWLAGFMLTGPSSKHAIKRAQEVNDDIVRRVRLKASA